ncbi:MAG: hypothetical protein SAL70_09215 [Scytonema sp. PMC 1070.18]|nr:hypothetical protein [Scytonema sp. PMC 1070.18]
MNHTGETKRLNFNVSPNQEARIESLRVNLGAATFAETILRSITIVVT